MSFSFNKKRGIGVALIKDGKYDKKTIYFNDKNNKGKEEIIVEKGKLLPLQNAKKNQREVVYLSGPSGAGKSTWIGNYIKQYKRKFKKNEVYVISSIGEDDVIDKYEPIRLEIDADFISEGPLEPELFQDSLVVLDDVDTISDKTIKRYITDIRDFLLEQGRHTNTTMLMSHHLLSNYKATRIMLNEATTYVLFPKVNGAKLKKFLETNLGMGDEEYQKLRKLPSRWVAIYRTYPHFVMYEKGIYILE